MKSIVKQIGQIKTYEGQYGTMYSAFITLEDGTSGLVNAKTEDNLKGWLDNEVEYETETKTSSNGNEYYKLKLRKPQEDYKPGKKNTSSSSYRDERAMNRRTALMQAVIVDAKNWKQVAFEMYEWLEVKPKEKEKEIEQTIKAPVGNEIPGPDESDLPW